MRGSAKNTGFWEIQENRVFSLRAVLKTQVLNICRRLIGEVASSHCHFLQAALISEQVDIFSVRYQFTEESMWQIFFFLLESITTVDQYEGVIV